MKILMIAYDNDAYIHWFPQGLAYLATVARENNHEVSIYQQDVYHWPEEHLTKHLNDNNFDIVVLSVIGGYYQYEKLLKISKAINESVNRLNFKYLIGGHGPSPDPSYFLDKTKADFICIGEGELTFAELLSYFENKNSNYHLIDGIAFIDCNGDYKINKRRELIKDIDTISFPAYDLFDITHYSLFRLPNIKSNERSLPILSGRGCTFSCNFCYRLDKGFRPRSAGNIIQEIIYLKNKYNIKYFAFSDELLMSSRKRTLDLCQEFIDAKLNIKWDCNGRLNYADIDVLEKMKEAGCVFINYGIESLNNDTLKIMHKGLTKDIIIKGVENTLKVGISPGLNIIYGNINEPLESIDEAVEFLSRYDDHAQLRTIRPVTPYPGSELFDIAVEKGLIRNVDDFYANRHLNSDLLSANFTQYSDEDIYEALHKANSILIDKYIDHLRIKMKDECSKLYKEKNTKFRGFRQS